MCIKKQNKGFTLAEVLITLTVIGIVAAITIPALMSGIDERTWKTQKKALQTRITNAILDMPKISGYGEFKTETVDGQQVTTDTAAEAFLVDGLSKVYKMDNICTSKNIKSCGIPETYTNVAGTKVDFPTKSSFTKETSVAAFQTPNGESVAVFYNPDCSPVDEVGDYTGGYEIGKYKTLARACVNFVYDLNGLKSPNKIGKDIGIIAVTNRDTIRVVAPVFYEKVVGKAPLYKEDGTDAQTLCKNESKDLRLPTIDELIAYRASRIFGMNEGGYRPDTFWLSNTVVGTGENAKVLAYSPWYSNIQKSSKTTSQNVVCVYE